MQQYNSNNHNLSFMKQYSLENRHLLFFSFDLIIIVISAIFSYYLINNNSNIPFNYKIIILINTLIILLSSSFNRLYCSWRGLFFVKQLYKVFSIWFFSFACLLILLFFSKQTNYFSMPWIQTWFVMGATLTCLYRAFTTFILNKIRQQGKNIKKIILVGNGKIMNDIVKISAKHPEYGFNITQIIKLSTANSLNKEIFKNLSENIGVKKHHELWICLPLSEGFIVKKILHNLRYSTVEIRFFPDFEDMNLLNYDATNLMGFHSLNLSCSSITDTNALIKRYEDIILAIIILMVISIPSLIIMFLIKVTSKGPIFFKQQRHGINKRIFEVYKFRTMEIHSEQTNTVTQATKNDPRITKLGVFLRKTSIDEFPQFVNVLQGNMSIVGPRPHALSHNEYYKDLVDSYMWRHKVKPGITGWAQVNGYRGETDTLEKMQKRVEHDLWYIENWSLYLDLKITLLTVFKGFINKNAY